MTTDNRRTEISEPGPSNIDERNSSMNQTVLEKALDELESIQMEEQAKNVLVTIINLMINSGDAKAMVRLQRESANSDCSMELLKPKEL
jgi:hypothetical protein